jgi:HSP20 family protein
MTTLTKSAIGKIRPTVFSNMFEPFFRRELGDWFDGAVDTVPDVNISETDGRYHLEMAAPGLKKEDFTISVDGDLITISSEKESETKKEEKDYSRREYNYSSFSRSFSLPDLVDQDKISAQYQDGILRLDLPKKSSAQINHSKHIKIA